MKITSLLTLFVLSFSSTYSAETIRIAIGTQDTTTNTAAGGPVPRELKLVEKYLPHDGKYKDVTYDIQWKSFPSGPPLNSELLANKLDIGQMADFRPFWVQRPFRSPMAVFTPITSRRCQEA